MYSVCVIFAITEIDMYRDEIGKFGSFAQYWWDESGPVKMLHAMNPVRVKYVLDNIKKSLRHLNDEEYSEKMKHLRVLDAGCGGGILSMPIAKLGFDVTAIDPSNELINVAKERLELERRIAASSSNEVEKIRCKFINADLMNFEDEKKYDVILVSEVIEHVDNLEFFLARCNSLLLDDGIIFISTINRTLKSLVQAKIAAEYIFRLLAPGSHDWRKFVKPEWLVKTMLGIGKYSVIDISGLRYNILSHSFQLVEKYDVNYFIILQKC